MKIRELIEILQTYPQDFEVWLEDPNFGGGYSEIEKEDITDGRTSNHKCNAVLIAFPFEEPVD
jgi:hypothetical protein